LRACGLVGARLRPGGRQGERRHRAKLDPQEFFYREADCCACRFLCHIVSQKIMLCEIGAKFSGIIIKLIDKRYKITDNYKKAMYEKAVFHLNKYNNSHMCIW
jgi:hypothetical protein